MTIHGQRITMNQTAIKQSLGDEFNAAGSVQIAGDKSTTRLEVGDQRGTTADGIEIVNGQLDLCLLGDGEQMQHRIGGTTRRRHRSDGILDGFARDDPRWSQVTAQKLDYELPGVESGFVLFRNRRWDTITPDRRDSQNLHARRQCGGGERPPAGPCAGESGFSDGFNLFLINSAAAVAPPRFEAVLNRQVATAEMPGRKGTAVERESRN